jgi:GT2 family glycosyltransferase/glycosyltransferase involved in cell wall biosynthesis
MTVRLLKRLAKRVLSHQTRHFLRRLQQDLRRPPRQPPPAKYDIVYVMSVVGLGGGPRVIMEHVSRLRARGHRAAIFAIGGDGSWFPHDAPVHLFGSAAELRRHLNRVRGIKVATWHETAPMVAASLREGDRGYYLVQDIEEWYGESAAQRDVVQRTYRLGLQTISEGLWVEKQLRERFGLDPVQVRIGLDLETFRPRGGERRTQQIMTQARTWSGGVGAGNRIKGWDIAQAVIHRTWAANPRTDLLTFSMEDAPPFPESLTHVHHHLPSDDQLAELYSTAGLYLLTSRHEGFGLTAAEAMACGCPVVATRADGNEEFCIDGETALTADPSDIERLKRHCLRLQREPELAEELARRGLRLIREYTWERVIDRLEAEFAKDKPAVELPDDPPVRSAHVMQRSPEDLRRIIPLSDVEHPDLSLGAEPDCEFTVVIPTVGAAEKVVECVTSCRLYAPTALIEFVVVDDGTPDAAQVEVLQVAAEELGFELRRNHQNLGFSAAVNHGLRGARGEFTLICNNDVRFDRPWAGAVRAAFESDPQTGIVGARLLYGDGMTIQHAGTDKVPRKLGYVHTHAHAPAELPAARASRPVWYATGALVALSRTALRRLGGFSTAYGLAYEDLDYCLRAWLMGVRVLYCGEFAARHQEGATRGATTAQKRARPLVWLQREEAGKAYFQRKWSAMQFVEELGPFLRFSEQPVEAAHGGAQCGAVPSSDLETGVR